MVDLKNASASAVDFTPRQLQLIALLAEGRANKEIAEELRISSGTVKQHLVVLFRKMGVPNRSKAALIAQRLVRDRPRLETAAKPQPVAGSAATPYQWRLLSAVALALPESGADDPPFLKRRNEALANLHRYVRQLVEALDGKTMPAPCGGIIAWFGHPLAHQDDADRVVDLVTKVQAFAAERIAAYPVLQDLGMGIANLAEMVEEDALELYSVRVFGIALALARNSQRLHYPLATPLTARLIHTPARWLRLRDGQDDKQTRSGLPLALATSDPVGLDLAERWGGLPFVDSLCNGVKNGLAQWVSVSSWPLSSTPFLMAALGVGVREQGFRVIDIRLPTRKSRHILMTSFFEQIQGLQKFSFDARRTAGERLAGLIRSLAEAKPLCLIIHGQDGLQIFRQALTDKGVDQLVTMPVMVIGQSALEDKPQAIVRTLGPRANGKPFSRAFVLQVPEFESVMDRLRLDVRALLDALSSVARRLVLLAAHRADLSIASAVETLEAPVYEIQAALQELQASGLIQASAKTGFEFRDPLLPRAICEQDVDLGVAEPRV